MTVTIDEKLRKEGYRVVATLDRTELFQRAVDEIPGIEEMDYFIVPQDIAFCVEPLGPAYAGFHRIYLREK